VIDRVLEDQLDTLVEWLMAYASAHTGFSAQALRREAIHQAVRAELPRAGGFDALLRELAPGAPGLDALLRRAVLVGETYFFRQREHFALLAEVAVPGLLATGHRRLRAWSAGCSTGEEAYSLAACLLHEAGAEVEVVGTDISEQSLLVAREGEYSRWSSRDSAPALYPVCAPAGPDRLRVLDRVAQVTSFRQHNLLEPAEPALGRFQIIFCRNVLAYFSAAAARIAAGHLVGALEPGGYLVFGAMDLEHRPDGVDLVGPPGEQVFRKRGDPPPAVSPAATAAAPAPPRSGGPGREEAPADHGPLVAGHLRALQEIERGSRAAAEHELTQLRRRAPGYLPGLLELSLLHLRNGRRGPAEELMREILLRAAELPEDHVCPGPEPLPVSFYLTAARAFLGEKGGA
jgi:chemotaxis protein methyltransferase CheR